MNYKTIVAALEKYPTLRKDGNRIMLFFKACAKKETALYAANDIKGVEQFAEAVAAHIAVYVKRLGEVAGNPWKLFGDPFKGEREATRVFAKFWTLDDEFVKAMG